MKLVVYSSRTQGFDGRIFVVRTVNTLDTLMGPQPHGPVGVTPTGHPIGLVWYGFRDELHLTF
jgi:hypothetical protein